ncbi:hypothetical protein [Riemerella columbina]|uniref:hypothetical protein n=1 Tax=Riemerella columbina TaxID=103810 RepID=UPI00266FCAC0|nr:hypothetical protein [Riemerella columbina]WKS95096.1 hypothetical protein NYR17_09285 [Riemerella columbina]
MDCHLNIIAGYKNQQSYLKDTFVTLPFRVVPTGQRKNDGKLYAMVMSSSPGILSGDHYHLKMTVEDHLPELAEQIYTLSSHQADMEVDVSLMQQGGLVVRALGQGDEALYQFFLEIQELLWENTLTKTE